MGSRNISKEILVTTGQFSKEKEYWTNKLSKDLPVSHFPYDYYRTDGEGDKNSWSGCETGIAGFQVNGKLFSKLTSISNHSDSRLFIILVAGLMLLLHKYTHHENIIVGAPIDRQPIEGTFINTLLALRNAVSATMTFKELLFSVRQTIVEACENQNYPLETLPYELNMPSGENDDFPLFHVGILLGNIHDKSYISHIKLNMIFSFLRKEESIEGEVEYNPLLYKKEGVEDILYHFPRLLYEAIKNADTPVVNLEILTTEEKKRLLDEINDTQADYPGNKTIHGLFREQVEKTPAHTAAEESDTGRLLSYRELNDKANQLSGCLRERGVGPGTIAAIMGERQLEIIIGILAILKTGAGYLPLDAQNPDERIKFILKDSRASVFLSQPDIIHQRQDMFREFSPGSIIDIHHQEIYKGKPVDAPGIDIASTELAYIIYTSGTTGKPKGVMIRHKSLVNYITWAVKKYVTKEPVNFPFYTSIGFDLTVTSIFTPLVTGNAIVIYSGWNKGNLIERIVKDNKVGVIKLTPAHLSLIQHEKLIPTGGIENSPCLVKRLVVGGEMLEYQLAQDIHHNFNGDIEIYNEYGPTEATVGCMIYKFKPGKDKGISVSIGVPVDNAGIYLLDKNLKPVPIGAVGELYVSGAGLAVGYLNNVRLTAEKFLANPFKKGEYMYQTGDLGKWLPNNNLEFLGRIDQQIKLRGFRIELGEIENGLQEHEHIKKALVVIHDPADTQKKGEKLLCAYIVADKELTASALREYLAGKLPDYMIPSFFVKLDKIPLNTNGKVDWKALPPPDLQGETEYVPPGNKMEEQLVEIWSTVLGRTRELIGIKSNFFEMGGHSLSATVLIAEIHKAFEVKIPLVDIFRFPTIKGLTAHIKNSKEVKTDVFLSIKPVEKKEYSMLSSMQRRLYVLQQMDLQDISYNVTQGVILEGQLERAHLERAFQKLINRHESLRTSFHMILDKPVQRIHDHVEFKMEYHESSSPGMAQQFVRPFDLSQAPLIRVGLLKLNDNKHLLRADMHHIISDGVSQAILVQDFARLYNQQELPALTLQYKDFSYWQTSEHQVKAIQQQKEYWLNEFVGEIPVLNLATDYPRAAVKNSQGSIVTFEIEREEFKVLSDWALKEQATLTTVLLTVFYVLLLKLSGQEDMVIGVPSAGRQHADLKQIIGMFVNTLALRNYPENQKPFIDFLGEVKENMLKAFENQDYPFEELVEQVAVKRDVSRHPLFDVMLVQENVGFSPIEIPGLTLLPYEYEKRISKFDLTLWAVETPQNLVLRFEYCTKLFKKETIEGFAVYYRKIISSVIKNPKQAISGIEIITGEEKTNVLFHFNHTEVEYPKEKTIHELFQEQVEKTPLHKAAVCAGRTYQAEEGAQEQQLTYQQLNEKSNRLSHRLKKMGVIPGAVVGIMVERSLEMVIGVLAGLKAGGLFLPVDFGFPEPRKRFIIRDSGTEIILTTGNLFNDCKQAFPDIPPERILYLEEKGSYSENPDNPGRVNSPRDPAYIIYTSGTTGQPKGVVIEHRGLVNYVCWAANTYVRNEAVDFPLYTSISFDLTITSLFTPLLTGNGIIIYREEEKEVLIEKIINENRVGVIKLTPSHLKLIRQKNIMGKASHIRTFILGGEALETDLAAHITRNFKGQIEIYNEYGPTETVVGSSIYKYNPEIDIGKSVPIGIPINNTQIYILDKNRNPLPAGVPGYVYISGDGVARGYLNRQELTRDTFVPNPFIPGQRMYMTGDRGRWLQDGNLEYLGREDSQVKVRGFRIELAEIEYALLKHETIKEVVVMAQGDEPGGQYLCAYIVFNEGGSFEKNPDSSSLREYLIQSLPGYMIPSHFIEVAEIPLTLNGKLDSKTLTANGKRLGTGVEFVPPQKETEKIIANTWKEILKLDRVGINDNFFEMGGNSINIIQVNLRLKEELNLDIPIVSMFQYPTIGSLANHLAPGDKENRHSRKEKELENLHKIEESMKETVELFDDL